MSDIKKAHVVWKGSRLDFSGSLGSDYRFELRSPAGVEGASPMELILAGVAGCTAMDVTSMLRKQRQNVTGVEVAVEGIRAETPPQVYTDLSLRYIIYGQDVDPRSVERAIELSQSKYCSASIMLKRGGVNFHNEFQIVESGVVAADVTAT